MPTIHDPHQHFTIRLVQSCMAISATAELLLTFTTLYTQSFQHGQGRELRGQKQSITGNVKAKAMKVHHRLRFQVYCLVCRVASSEISLGKFRKFIPIFPEIC